MKRFVKLSNILYHTLYLLAILLLATIITTFLYISEKPRSIKFFLPTFEKIFDNEFPDFKTKIDDVILSWDKDNHQFTFKLNNFKLLKKNTHTNFIKLPYMNLGIDFSNIFNGEIISAEIEIHSPNLKLIYHDNEQVEIIEEESQYSNFLKDIMDDMKGKTSFFIKKIKIHDASLFIKKPDKEFAWKFDIENDISIKKKSIYINSYIKADFNGEEASFEAETNIDKNESITTNFNFTDLPAYIFKELIPQLNKAKNLDKDKFYLVLSGSLNVNHNITENNTKANIILDKGYGKIHLKEYFPNELILNNLSLKANLINENIITIKESNIEFADGPSISTDGIIKFANINGEILPELNIDININKLKVDDIKYYWPMGAANEARDWVTNNISKGNVIKAKGRFDIKPQYIKTGIFPKNAINATVEFENSTVNYYEQFPSVDHVSGKAQFTANDVDISISSGELVHSKLKDARVYIYYGDQIDPYLSITGKTNGNAIDLTEYIPKDIAISLEKEGHEINKLSGYAESNVNIHFPLKNNFVYEDISFVIESNLSNIAIPKLAGQFYLEDANLKGSFDGKKISLDGNGLINGNTAKISWDSFIQDNSEFSNIANIKLNLDENNFKNLNLPDQIALNSGIIKSDITIKTKDNVSNIAIRNNLKHAAFSYDALGYSKVKDIPANFDLHLIISPKKIIIPNIKFISEDNILIKGDARLDSNLNLESITLKEIQTNKSNFKMSYNKNNKLTDFNIEGVSADLSSISYGKLFSSDKKDKDTTQKFKIKLDKIYMKNDQILSNVVGNFECIKNDCHEINFMGNIGEGYFRVMSSDPNNKHKFSLESNNAGGFLAAFDIYKNFSKGMLTANLTSIKKPKDKDYSVLRLEGDVTIKRFVAIQTPLVTKIITLASLPGLINILNSNTDIPFEKFSGRFSYEEQLFILKDGKAKGDYLGFTIEGLANTKNSQVNFSGIIVPTIYGVNTVLGKIPMLGNVLLGGEGGGLIAANYQVQGSSNDTKTSVNPLSLLTPGFMRKLFNIFDAKAPE